MSENANVPNAEFSYTITGSGNKKDYDVAGGKVQILDGLGTPTITWDQHGELESTVKFKPGDATTLYKDTYSSMFEGCTSLIEGPEIMATTIANTNSTACMQRMFCMNRDKKVTAAMTKSPVLRIVNPTTANNTYQQLFCGNGSLTEVTILAEGTNFSFANWLNNVSSSGVIKKLSATTLTNNSVNGKPSGWTYENID
jgi:hypothetical protein